MHSIVISDNKRWPANSLTCV